MRRVSKPVLREYSPAPTRGRMGTRGRSQECMRVPVRHLVPRPKGQASTCGRQDIPNQVTREVLVLVTRTRRTSKKKRIFLFRMRKTRPSSFPSSCQSHISSRALILFLFKLLAHFLPQPHSPFAVAGILFDNTTILSPNASWRRISRYPGCKNGVRETGGGICTKITS